jgi:hypothetical protein
MTPTTKDWHKYETLAGEVLRYPAPAPDVEAYLRRVRRAVYDAEIGEDAMIDLVYARENPVLDPTVFAERGAVTRRVFANPLYGVLTDLLDRKRAQLGVLDPVAASARYTMTVEEAAAELDVKLGVVVHAIRLGQLGTWRTDGVRYLDPEAVQTFRRFFLERARPPLPAALRARWGHRPGVSFRIRADEIEVVATHRLRQGKVLESVVPPFEQIAIRFREGERHAFLVLEPSDAENELLVDEFGVAGCFKIVDQVSDPEEAARRWELFRPA